MLTGLKDPAALVASPWADTALVLGAEANAITILEYNPSSAATPFSVRGPLAASSTPQLPSVAVLIRRGTLTGRVIVAENLALRQVQLDKGGVVKEVELFSLGKGNSAIPGALGVQP